MANRTKFTQEARAKFLDVLRQRANVTEAATAAGMSRRGCYDARENDDAFAAEWDDAVQEGIDKLEGEMWRRAVEGTDKPVYQQGAMVGSIREYSDALAMFLAKGHRPQKYKDRTEISGDAKRPLRVEVMTDEQIEARLAEIRSAKK